MSYATPDESPNKYRKMSSDLTHEEIYGTSKAKGGSSSASCSPGKRLLDQDVFKGQPPEVVIAAVDFDGLLKFGDCKHIRFTWASERWRGAEWINEVEGTDYEPLTSLIRENVKPTGGEAPTHWHPLPNAKIES